jgi:hypothetical protein
MWGKRNPCILLMGMLVNAAIWENKMEATQKLKKQI